MNKASENPIHRYPIRPFDGWALTVAVELEDKASCNFISILLRASNLRRATVFALLAAGRGSEATAGEQAQSTIQTLLTERCSVLLRQQFGQVTGLVGTLGRTAGAPLKFASDYLLLVKLLQESGSARAGSLINAKAINSSTIQAVAGLHEDLLLWPIVEAARHKHQITQFNEALDFLRRRCSIALNSRIIGSAINEHQFPDPAELVSAVLQVFGDRFPTGPLNDFSFFTPIKTGKELVSTGREFKNCLADKVLQVALGRQYFYLAKSDPPSIVEIHNIFVGPASSSHWVVKEVHIKRNRPIDWETQAQVYEELFAHGLHRLTAANADDVTRQFAQNFSNGIQQFLTIE